MFNYQDTPYFAYWRIGEVEARRYLGLLCSLTYICTDVSCEPPYEDQIDGQFVKQKSADSNDVVSRLMTRIENT